MGAAAVFRGRDATEELELAPRRDPVPFLRRLDLLLVLVVVLGAALRFYHLGHQSLWFDEWSTADATRGGLERLLRYVSWREGTPPPYFVLVWGWVQVAGDSEVALRTVSAVAGTATVPVTYAIARELGQSPAVARIAALLVAVHPMLVWFSQEARPYSLLAFAGALSVLACVRLWSRGRGRDLVAWSLAGGLVLSVHYFGAFLVVAEGLCLLLGRRLRGRQLLLPALTCAGVAAAHAPFLLKQRDDWSSTIPLSDRLEEAGHTALVGPSVPDGRLWTAVAAVAALGLVLLAALVARGPAPARRAGILLAAIGVLAVAAPLAVDLAGPELFVSRYLVASTVPLVGALAIGLGQRGLRGVGLVGVGAVVAVSVGTVVAVSDDPDLQRGDWRAVADVVGPTDEDGSVRLLVMNRYGDAGSPLRYYLPDVETLDVEEAITVERIDVLRAKAVDEDKPCNLVVGRPCGYMFLGLRPPPPLGDQLVLEESVELDQFFVDRFRAERPIRVMVDDLVAADQAKHARVFVIAP